MGDNFAIPSAQVDARLRYGAVAQEGEVKTSKIVALTFAFALAGPLAAHAQATGETTAHPATPYHHYHVHHFQGPHLRHHVYHRFEHPAVAAPVVAPAPVVAAPAAQPQPFGLAFPHIAPYPDNKGDEDGLSEDQNDCNKGCIDGNTSD